MEPYPSVGGCGMKLLPVNGRAIRRNRCGRGRTHPAAHDVERDERSMNADVSNLQRKRGRRACVSPAGFVFQRQSVANRQRTCLLEHRPCARSFRLSARVKRRAIDFPACHGNIEIEAENPVSVQWPSMIEKQDTGKDQSIREDAPRAAERVSVEPASESDRDRLRRPGGSRRKAIDQSVVSKLARRLAQIDNAPPKLIRLLPHIRDRMIE
jgi:hypothetical protein